jgi:hypothetical protein
MAGATLMETERSKMGLDFVVDDDDAYVQCNISDILHEDQTKLYLFC